MRRRYPTPCTGFATRSTAKTNPKSGPDQAPESWQDYAISRSARSASSDAPTSPKPPDGPAAPCSDLFRSSTSPGDLETAVVTVEFRLTVSDGCTLSTLQLSSFSAGCTS